MRIKHKNEDFTLKLSIIDCDNVCVYPENFNSIEVYLYSESTNNKVKVDIDSENNIIINNDTLSPLEDGILKYEIIMQWNSNDYSDGIKTYIKRGETQIYLSN